MSKTRAPMLIQSILRLYITERTIYRLVVGFTLRQATLTHQFCLHPKSRRLFAPFYRSTQTPLQPLSVETSFTRDPTTPIRNSSSLKLPHRPIRNRRPINLRIRRVPLSLRSRPRALGIKRYIKRQITAHPAPNILLSNNLSLLPARKVALLAGHNLTRMDNVEEHEGNEHERGVEYVLVCFVDRDAAAVAAGVFD